MRVLVIGGTGKVGRRLVGSLRSRGIEAVPLARQPGAGGIAADIADVRSLEQLAKGFDAAFLSTPLGPDEGEIGVAACAALRRSRVGKIVYLAAHNLETMQAIPHFATKLPVRDAVLADPCGVVIAPNFFFQNDLLAMSAITRGGIYPLPIGDVGVWGIDAGDIAHAAARAIAEDGWNGMVVPLCGPERLTGRDVAANWAFALGRPVAYAGHAIGPFIDAMRSQAPGFNAWMAQDFTLMMEVTQAMGCPASEADRAQTEAILGRKPLMHEQFVEQTLKENAQ